MYIYGHISLSSPQSQNASEKIVEKIKTHILYTVSSSPHSPENRVENFLQLGSSRQIKICRMSIACLMHKAKHIQDI